MMTDEENPTEDLGSSQEDRSGYSSGRYLTEVEWADIRRRYELGEASAKELAAEYGVTASALSQHFKKHKIIKGSRKHEMTKIATTAVEKRAEAEAEELSKFARLRAERIEQTKEHYYLGHTFIDNEILRILDKVKKDHATTGSTSPPRYGDQMESMKALFQAKRALEIGRKERYAVLDIGIVSEDDKLPSLEIRDVTDDDIGAIQNDLIQEELGELLEENMDLPPDPPAEKDETVEINGDD